MPPTTRPCPAFLWRQRKPTHLCTPRLTWHLWPAASAGRAWLRGHPGMAQKLPTWALRPRGRRGASIFASTRFDHQAGEAVSLGWVGPTGATEDATLLWITSPGPWAPRQAPGSPSRRLSHPKAGEARRGFCPETPLRPAEELETFPHVLPTCTEGRQPPGPSREPVRPGDLQRLSRQGGRDPAVITVTRKRRGAERLRDSKEDKTSRASLRAASGASGESPGAHGLLTAPHPVPPGLCLHAWLWESPQASPPLAALPSTYPHNTQIHRHPKSPRCREGLSGAPPLVSPAPGLPTGALTPPSWPQEMAFFQERDHLGSVCLLAAGLGQPLPAQGPTAVSRLGLRSLGTRHFEVGGTLPARPQTWPFSSLSAGASGQHPPCFPEGSQVLCSPLEFFSQDGNSTRVFLFKGHLRKTEGKGLWGFKT